MTHEEIQLEAYYLWEAAGKPEGRSNYFWRQAILKLRARAITAASRQIGRSTNNILSYFNQLNWIIVEEENVKKPLICNWRKEGF